MAEELNEIEEESENNTNTEEQERLKREEQERLEQERLERERIERERLEREQAEQARIEQERIEHENFLKSFPDTTIFYQDLFVSEDAAVKFLQGVTDVPLLAEQLGILENHYDLSELTLKKGVFYLKGYEKPDETEAEIIRQKASEIDHELENLLDQTVQTRNYKNVESCVGYYNSTDKTFREEAEAVLKWRDSLYATAREILKQVDEGSIDYRIVDLKYITDRAEPLEW